MNVHDESGDQAVLRYLLLGFYFIFIGGSPYFYQIFPLRVAHHVIVTVLAVWWLARRFRTGLPLTPLNGLLYAAVGVWLIGAAFSLHPRMALENLWFPLTHLLGFFFIADMLQTGRQKRLFESVFLLAGVTVIAASYQLAAWFIGIPPLSATTVGWIDVLGADVPLPLNSPLLYIPLGVSTWLAAFTAALAVLTSGWALTARRRDYRVVLWGVAVGLVGVMLLTNSRGGLVALFAAVSVFVALRAAANLRRLTRRQLLIGGGLFAFVGITLALIVAARSASIARLTGDVLRFNLWDTAIRVAQDHPVLGVGAGLFGRAARLYRDPSYVDDRLGTAHNIILNTAAETGVIGLLVLLALAITVIVAWRRLWRAADAGRKLRLEAALAALIGITVQSLFDVFTNTPMLIVIALLTAYCVVEPRSLLDTPRRGQRWAALVGAGLFAVYGVGLLQADRAQAAFLSGLRGESLDEMRAAAALDPSLRLYDLQIHYLEANRAYARGALDEAVMHYEAALRLEPTWEIGWLNLAALEVERGSPQAALTALDHALTLNASGAPALHWARIAESAALADSALIVQRYAQSIGTRPPLSAFWGETELRREAVRRMIDNPGDSLVWRYLVAHIFFPESAAALVPDEPISADDWWVIGEHARLNGDDSAALAAFDRAVQLDPTNGDFYVSRARVQSDSAAARDLNIARLLGTWLSSPNAVAAEIATTPEERREWQRASVPPRIIDQNFEGVLYGGRVGSFEAFPQMRPLGRGTAVLQPLYDLAAAYEAEGQPQNALTVYRAILDAAPEETAARSHAVRLSESLAP